MNLKPLIFVVFLFSLFGNAQDLEKIRAEYPKAVENSEIANEMYASMAEIAPNAEAVLVAYKGAVSTLKAKFAKKKSDKMEFFKAGVALIEDAVKTAPENIEVRYIRLSVQQNSPKFLGYHKNKEEDREFIEKNLESTSSQDLKDVISEFLKSI